MQIEQERQIKEPFVRKSLKERFSKPVLTALLVAIAALVIGLLIYQILKPSQVALEKPLNDIKLYKYLELNNSLKVLLISDNTSQLAGAALAVKAGSFSDFPDLPGIAHFHEHMCFMGSEKYPSIDEFRNFLVKNAGKYNAYTAPELTNYYFSIANTELEHALDIYSRFFIDPLFAQAAVDKEVNAVNSEFEKNKQSQSFLTFSLLRLLAEPDNPLHKFSVGNLDTLRHSPAHQGINVVNRLKDFHAKYYSSNLMSLVVSGNYSLDQLESWVIEKFSPIADHGTKADKFNQHPYVKNLGSIAELVPIDDTQSIMLAFPVPSTKKHYKVKPLGYISQKILYKGKHSLFWQLNKQGYMHNIGADILSTSSFALLLIRLDVTEQGFQNIDNIIEKLFAWISLLREEAVDSESYNSYNMISQASFNYLDSPDLMTQLHMLAKAMGDYDEKLVLKGATVYQEYDHKLIKDYFSRLTPENALYVIVSKKFEQSTLPSSAMNFEPIDRESELYGIRYNVHKVPKSFINTLKSTNGGFKSELVAPPRTNPYAPTSLPEKDQNNTEESYSNVSAEVQQVSSAGGKLYYLTDTTYDVPRISGNFRFQSVPVFSDYSSSLNWLLYCEFLATQIKSVSYLAQEADFRTNFNCRQDGFTLSVYGWSDKFKTVVDDFMKEIANTFDHFSEDGFEVMKEKKLQAIANENMGLLAQRAITKLKFLLVKSTYLETNAAPELKALQFKEWQANTKSLIADGFIEGILVGNVSNEDSLSLLQSMSQHLKLNIPEKSLSSKIFTPTSTMSAIFREFSPQSLSHEHCIANYYHIGKLHVKELAILSLLLMNLHSEAFNYLRTEKQLGYIVLTGSMKAPGGNIGVYIVVQGPREDPIAMDEEIEEFLRRFTQKIKDYSQLTLDQMKSSLKQQLLQRDDSLRSKSERLFGEIQLETYTFKQREEIIQELDQIWHNDFVRLSERIFGIDRKKLSIQTFAKGSSSELPNIHDSTTKLFFNLEDLKKDLNYE